jgi:hypothetical protein
LFCHAFSRVNRFPQVIPATQARRGFAFSPSLFDKSVPARLITDNHSSPWMKQRHNSLHPCRKPEEMDDYEQIVDRKKDTVYQLDKSLIIMLT